MVNEPHIEHVTLHLTDECNLRCIHCHVASAQRRPRSFGAIDPLILKNLSKGCTFGEISIAGGEPTVVPERVQQLVDSLGGSADLPRFAVTTNGVTLPINDLRLWERLGARIQISMDGLHKQHDATHGKGSFRKTIANVQRAISRGFQVDVLIAVTKSNINELTEFLQLLDAIGVHGAGFLNFTPKGRGIMLANEVISAGEWREFVDSLWGEEGFSRLWLRPELCYLTVEEALLLKEGGTRLACNYYHPDFLYVDLVDGNVFPCGLLFDTPIRFGTLLKNSLSEIYMRVRSREPVLPRKCCRCPHAELCMGGCKSYAVLYGHPTDADPRCGNGFLPVCPFLYAAIPPKGVASGVR